MKPISRYMTEVSVRATISEIQQMPTEHGAGAILIENGPDKRPSSISFRTQTEYGIFHFQLPARLAQIEKILAEKHRRTSRVQIQEQAARTGWRIIRDWLEAQLS